MKTMIISCRACTFGHAVGCIDPYTSNDLPYYKYNHCICDTDGCNSAPRVTGSDLGVISLTLISVLTVSAREYYFG